MDIRFASRTILLAFLAPASFIEWNHYSKREVAGSLVYLPHACSEREAANRGDDREVWVSLTQSETYINEKLVPRNQIENITGALMDTRAERVIYLLAAKELSYGEVVHWVLRMQARSAGLAVFLVTSSQDRASLPGHCVAMPPEGLTRLHPATD
jgi:biopolymer transport protein ExbD